MRIDLNSKIFTKPIAHRGLWGGKILENSLTAYNNAILHGYPIEIDLYSSTDGEIFCFHDKTLNRMTGVDGYIYQKSSKEINSYRLLNSDEKIPTLREVLKLCENKVPLLIEIKDQPDKKIVERILDILKDYSGEFAIQSFNPLYINKVKKLAPEFIRGILSSNDYEDLKNEKPHIRFIIKNMALNFLIKPDFVSYKYTGIPLSKRKTKNKAVLSWTVTDEKTYARIKPHVTNVIFENFIPDEQ